MDEKRRCTIVTFVIKMRPMWWFRNSMALGCGDQEKSQNRKLGNSKAVSHLRKGTFSWVKQLFFWALLELQNSCFFLHDNISKSCYWRHLRRIHNVMFKQRLWMLCIFSIHLNRSFSLLYVTRTVYQQSTCAGWKTDAIQCLTIERGNKYKNLLKLII